MNKFGVLTFLLALKENQTPNCDSKELNNKNDLLLHLYYPSGNNLTIFHEERINFQFLKNIRNAKILKKRLTKRNLGAKTKQVPDMSDIAYNDREKINFTKYGYFVKYSINPSNSFYDKNIIRQRKQNRENNFKKDIKVIMNLRSNYQIDNLLKKWNKLLNVYKIECMRIKQITTNMLKNDSMSLHENLLKMKSSCELILSALQRMIIENNRELEKYFIIIFKLLEKLNYF